MSSKLALKPKKRQQTLLRLKYDTESSVRDLYHFISSVDSLIATTSLMDNFNNCILGREYQSISSVESIVHNNDHSKYLKLKDLLELDKEYNVQKYGIEPSYQNNDFIIQKSEELNKSIQTEGNTISSNRLKFRQKAKKSTKSTPKSTKSTPKSTKSTIKSAYPDNEMSTQTQMEQPRVLVTSPVQTEEEPVEPNDLILSDHGTVDHGENTLDTQNDINSSIIKHISVNTPKNTKNNIDDIRQKISHILEEHLAYNFLTISEFPKFLDTCCDSILNNCIRGALVEIETSILKNVF